MIPVKISQLILSAVCWVEMKSIAEIRAGTLSLDCSQPLYIHARHGEPEHFISDKNKCTVIYLCPCVSILSRLEGILMKQRWLTFPNIISSQVSSNVVNYFNS